VTSVVNVRDAADLDEPSRGDELNHARYA
jgi:hypothetical protein